MLARPRVAALVVALVVAGSGFYLARDALFAQLAAGTRWVLVACGFETPEGAPGTGAQRVRALFYAVRMFRDVPPAQLSADDAWANARYPGMGFGLVRTLDATPVRVVLGGWRYVVPCVYFADARDCRRPDLRVMRLRMRLPAFQAMTRADIPRFLATADAQVATVILAAPELARPAWQLPPAQARTPQADLPGAGALEAYAWPDGVQRLYRGADDDTVRLLCTPPEAADALGIAAQCRDRFTHRVGAQVELRYAYVHLGDWARLRARVAERLDAFRHAGPEAGGGPTAPN